MGTELTVPLTLREAIIFYADPKVCVDLLVAIRWPNGVACPHCEAKNVKYMDTVQRFKCYGCRKQFSVKVGTILEDSPISLSKWLPAFCLLTSAKNGISSYELSRALGVTQKTAWFMLHRIRHILKTGTFTRLEGTVEADETFIGGKAKNMHKAERERKIHGRGAVGKAVVMGILERGETYTDKHGEEKKNPSRIDASVIADTSKETLHGEVKATVEPGAELMTDAARGYRGLSDFYKHQFIDHAVTYVGGKVYTNGLENFWSLTKRTLKGIYVSVEPGHLLACLDEHAFRFNERAMDDAGRFLMAVSQAAGRRLTYKELIGNPQGVFSPDPLRGGPRQGGSIIVWSFQH